jgi:hypothetical protein
LTPKYRLLRKFWVKNRFTPTTNSTAITAFYTNLTVEKVVDNFVSFPTSIRTPKFEFI